MLYSISVRGDGVDATVSADLTTKENASSCAQTSADPAHEMRAFFVKANQIPAFLSLARYLSRRGVDLVRG